MLKLAPTGLKWDNGMDAFATGCVLAELFIRQPLLYPCKKIQERLTCLERLNGLFTPRVAAAMEAIHPQTFMKKSSPPRINFTHYPIPVPRDLDIEERRALNRVGSIGSLFVSLSIMTK
jgi:hypothetical protein